LQKVTMQKIKGLVNIARKAGYLIIGSDNLKGYDKKLYLILKSDDCGKNIEKITEFNKEKTKCEVLTFAKDEYVQMIEIINCKIVGLKNKGIADEIIKLCKEK